MTHYDDEQMYDAMIDLAAGRLDGAEAEALQRRIQDDPALAHEYAGVAVLVRDLEAMGDDLVSRLEPIDVVDQVLSRVATLAPDESKVVPFAAPERRKPGFLAWAAAAAAAAAVIAAAWFGLRHTEQAPLRDIAQDRPADTFEPVDWRAVPLDNGTVELPPGTQPGDAEPDVDPADAAEPPTVLAMKDLSASDIIAQRQAAARDEEARNVLARWAALSPENARSILSNSEASTDAIVGAALSLGGADAVPHLEDALTQNPRDPFLNLELAKATGETPNPALDDENALGWYIYARDMLSSDPPNLAEALKALETAKNYTKAHAYTLEAAQYHEEALVASGMPEDSARLVTAFTSGPAEYEEMVALGNDLLNYAQYFQELGDNEAALLITESVQRFGQQLDVGALFSHERFAGLELQTTALNILETMYGSDRTDTLVQNMEAVTAGFNNLVSFIGNLNEFLGQSLPGDVWRYVADIIMQQGDLQIFNNLPPTPPQ